MNVIPLYLITLTLLFGCKLNSETPVDRGKFTFKTGDDTELFFKNIRASYYEKEERKMPRWDIFRHEDLYNDTSGYALNVAIVINIIGDEAYLLLEPGYQFSHDEPIVVHWTAAESNQNGDIILDQRNKENMLEFTAGIYEALRNNKKLELKTQNGSIPLYEDQSRKEAFRMTVSDYFRLTRIF